LGNQKLGTGPAHTLNEITWFVYFFVCYFLSLLFYFFAKYPHRVQLFFFFFYFLNFLNFILCIKNASREVCRRRKRLEKIEKKEESRIIVNACLTLIKEALLLI
jgi:hypothetical protein